MRKGLFVLVSAVGVATVSASASAQMAPVVSDVAETSTYRITGPYDLLGTPFTAPEAGILYSNTTETGSRFNPGTGGTVAGTGVQQDVTFDDIAIPNARLGGATSVDITKITVGIRRAGNAPATDINLFWGTATTTVTDPDTELDVPYNVIGTQSLAARSAAAFVTEQV